MLLYMHRQENVDDKKRVKQIFRGLDKVAKKTGLPVIFPIHPRTRRVLRLSA